MVAAAWVYISNAGEMLILVLLLPFMLAMAFLHGMLRGFMPIMISFVNMYVVRSLVWFAQLAHTWARVRLLFAL